MLAAVAAKIAEGDEPYRLLIVDSVMVGATAAAAHAFRRYYARVHACGWSSTGIIMRVRLMLMQDRLPVLISQPPFVPRSQRLTKTRPSVTLPHCHCRACTELNSAVAVSSQSGNRSWDSTSGS